MREYVTPDFDVTVYEIEEICVLSGIGGGDPNPGGDNWYD